MNTKNYFVLEGLDGSGTTTQCAMLAERLNACGIDAAQTFEPTDSPIGAVIRSILCGSYPAHPATLAYLFAADRHNHLFHPESGIHTMLEAGTCVVQDRYVFSSLAYQSVQCGYDLVSTLNNNFPLPEITFFLDIPVEVCLNRLEQRKGTREIFEKQAFLQQVRSSYQAVFSSFADTAEIITVDAALSREAVHEQIWAVIVQRMSIPSP